MNDATNQAQSTDTTTTESTTTKQKLVALQAYRTTDGKNFFDADEAAAWQSSLDNRDAIEAFLVKANIGKAQAGMLRNMLPQFLAFHAEVADGKDISDLLKIVADNEAKEKADAKAKADAKKAEEAAKAGNAPQGDAAPAGEAAAA